MVDSVSPALRRRFLGSLAVAGAAAGTIVPLIARANDPAGPGSFTKPFTNAVAATILARFVSQPINVVTDFGADNTGSIAANTAVGNAITAAAANNKPLYFPAGTYELGSGLLVLLSNMTVFGDGEDVSILRMSVNAQSPMFYLDNLSNVSISQLQIKYTAGTVGVLGYCNAGILLRNGCQNIKIDHVTIVGQINRPINLINSRLVEITNFYALGWGDGAIRLVSDFVAGVTINAENSAFSNSESAATPVEDITISSFRLDGAATQGSNTPLGFYGLNLAAVNSANGDLIQNCTFGPGVVCNTAFQGFEVGGHANGIKFTGCVARSSDVNGNVGFLVQEQIGLPPVNVGFDNCSVIGYHYGFWNQGINYVGFSNCFANGCGANGMLFSVGSVDSNPPTYCSVLGGGANGCGGDGFSAAGLSSSTVSGFNSSGNTGNGITMDGTGTNTQLAFCQAHLNGGSNYSIGSGVLQVGNL